MPASASAYKNAILLHDEGNPSGQEEIHCVRLAFKNKPCVYL
jgi:hypothetical protein